MKKLRVLRIAVLTAALLTLGACSRVQTDWKTAQAADTIEAYGDFLRKHSDATEAAEARARIEQLGEDRDWQRASTSDTREAYAQFIALHPNSKWTQEARIRIENFALGPTPLTPATTATAATATGVAAEAAAPKSPVSASVPASEPARATAPVSGPAKASVPKEAPAPKTAEPRTAVASASHTVPAKATPAKVSSAGSGQAIQLGAFNSEAVAQEQWQKLAKRHAELGSLKPRTETIVSNGRTLFRLRTEVPDNAAALKTCAALQRSGDACLVVSSQR